MRGLAGPKTGQQCVWEQRHEHGEPLRPALPRRTVDLSRHAVRPLPADRSGDAHPHRGQLPRGELPEGITKLLGTSDITKVEMDDDDD